MRYARIGCISGDWLRLEGGAPLQTMRLPRPTAATREAPPGMMVRARGGSEQGRVGALGSGNWVCRWGSWCAARHGRFSSGPSRRRWARYWSLSNRCSCSTGAVPWCATATCRVGRTSPALVPCRSRCRRSGTARGWAQVQRVVGADVCAAPSPGVGGAAVVVLKGVSSGDLHEAPGALVGHDTGGSRMAAAPSG